MELPSPGDMEPLTNIQLDTRLTQRKETETISLPTSREILSNDDISLRALMITVLRKQLPSCMSLREKPLQLLQ